MSRVTAGCRRSESLAPCRYRCQELRPPRCGPGYCPDRAAIRTTPRRRAASRSERWFRPVCLPARPGAPTDKTVLLRPRVDAAASYAALLVERRRAAAPSRLEPASQPGGSPRPAAPQQAAAVIARRPLQPAPTPPRQRTPTATERKSGGARAARRGDDRTPEEARLRPATAPPGPPCWRRIVPACPPALAPRPAAKRSPHNRARGPLRPGARIPPARARGPTLLLWFRILRSSWRTPRRFHGPANGWAGAGRQQSSRQHTARPMEPRFHGS